MSRIFHFSFNSLFVQYTVKIIKFPLPTNEKLQTVQDFYHIFSRWLQNKCGDSVHGLNIFGIISSLDFKSSKLIEAEKKLYFTSVLYFCLELLLFGFFFLLFAAASYLINYTKLLSYFNIFILKRTGYRYSLLTNKYLKCVLKALCS